MMTDSCIVVPPRDLDELSGLSRCWKDAWVAAIRQEKTNEWSAHIGEELRHCKPSLAANWRHSVNWECEGAFC
eukprot:3048450-Amphidinium_carterae.1